MEAETSARSSIWPLFMLGALFVIGIGSVVAWNVELPYVAFSAGPVSDAADAVFVDTVEVYPPDGELLMLTVVSQDVNVFEALIAGVDPNIDLVKKTAVRRPGESDEEYRNRVLQQMDDSNFRSVAAALQYLGYEMVPVEVVVNDFVEGVPAAELLELGDTIVSINGVPIAGVADIGPLITQSQIGSQVTITVLRGEEELDLEVELVEREDEEGVPMIGVLLGELTEPPFPVAIRAGDVGGPSAGMMHALAIIDTLTQGELTRGHVIAGTGTIQIDGSVGAIGGIRQKVVGAEAAGAEYILVPADNYATALTAERDRIEIVPVSTLHEALDFLEQLPAI